MRRTAPPVVIGRAIRWVLDDPGYRQAAERLGAVIRHDADQGAVVDELEALPDDVDRAR